MPADASDICREKMKQLLKAVKNIENLKSCEKGLTLTLSGCIIKIPKEVYDSLEATASGR